MDKNNKRISKKIFEKCKEEDKKIIKRIKNNNKRTILFIIVFSILLCGISSIASYTLAANQVSYTAKDINWNVNNTKDAIDELRDRIGASLVGSVFSYMGTSAPSGYLACDGTEYNISDYPKLAEHINTNFGSYNYFGGDGETTFKVPDLRGEFLRGTGTNNTTNLSGADVGVHQSQGLPNITGIFSNINHISVVSASGALSVTTSYETGGTNGGSNFRNRGPTTHIFNASTSDSIYGNSDDIRPSNTSILYIIKY